MMRATRYDNGDEILVLTVSVAASLRYEPVCVLYFNIMSCVFDIHVICFLYSYFILFRSKMHTTRIASTKDG